MKIVKAIAVAFTSLVLIGIIILFEIRNWPVGSSLAGIGLGFVLPYFIHCVQDIFDTSNWKTSQRRLERGRFIKEDTIIRISFAYLYRIKIDNKYLLVKNERKTGKYQPVGGVYKFNDNEKLELKNRFKVIDDDKIPIDESSRDDYRLRIANKYLRKMVKRFDDKAQRERIDNIGREFKEELIEKGILNWKQITYRFCGRHMTELKFSQHFQIYELLLADVVELIPTEEQEKDLIRLMSKKSELYYFATTEEIASLGVNTYSRDLKEIIADHANKILQENEGKLMKITGVGKMYTISV